MNFDNLNNECENYYTGKVREFEIEVTLDDPSLAWGFTYYETFTNIIKRLPKPRRFIVFGCSIGYQCFFWNNLYPDVEAIGIDLLKSRIDWGIKKIEEYSIKNVELIHGDIRDFEVQDGDLIWQNDLLISEEFIFNLTLENLKKDVRVVSYQHIHNFNDDELNFLEDQTIKVKNDFYEIIFDKVISKTSWDDDSTFYIFSKKKSHWGDLSENIKVQFDVNFIYPELIIPEKNLKNYEGMILSRKDVEIEIFKTLYNKNNLKELFVEFEFNVPKTYLYSTEKKDIIDILDNLKTYVAKPAHMSESVDVIVNSSKSDYTSQFVNDVMNKSLDVSDYENFRRSKISGGVWWKDCEKGFIIEQLVNVKWELKIFVIWGEPFLVDLRTSKTEFSRVDFISKKNDYLNWDNEYEKIKKLAIYLKVDFFRIDFLYDGEKLWASELAFMPGTFFPNYIEERIVQEWRQPYFKHYYPFLC